MEQNKKRNTILLIASLLILVLIIPLIPHYFPKPLGYEINFDTLTKDSTIGELGDENLVDFLETQNISVPNLVLNSDFSQGTTYWTSTSGSVTDGIYRYFPSAPFNTSMEQSHTILANNKYYFNVNFKANNNQVRIRFGLELVGSHSGSYNFETISGLHTTTENSTKFLIRDERGYSPNYIYVDWFIVYDVTTLIDNQIYSPLFDTTFDLMSDTEIEQQLDYWVANNTAGNNFDLLVPKLTYEITNLVVNGDFSNGTTGWFGSGSILSNNNGIVTMTGTGSNTFTLLYRDNENITDVNLKYYQTHKFRVTNNKSIRVSITFDGSTGGTDKNVITQNNPVINQWYILSVINTLPSDATGFNRTKLETIYNNITDQNGSSTDIDYIYRVNVSELILNEKFSPLYGTTFDLMTDEQIKTQLDYCVANNTDGNNLLLYDYTPYYKLYTKLLDGTYHEIDGDFYINGEYWVYLPTLITNKQYSPMFNTTFDLMLDNERKIQLDNWFISKILPN